MNNNIDDTPQYDDQAGNPSPGGESTPPGQRLRRLLTPPQEENLTIPVLPGDSPLQDPNATVHLHTTDAAEPGGDHSTIRLSEAENISPDDESAITQPNHIDASEDRTIPPAPVSDGAPGMQEPVDVFDHEATSVTPAAYWQPMIDREPPSKPADTPPVHSRRPAPPSPQPAPARPRRQVPSPQPPPPPRPRAKPNRVGHPRNGGAHNEGGSLGCAVQGFIIMVILAILSIIIVASVGVFEYFAIARTLPDVDELYERASKFETTRILDREGNLLYEIIDPNAGRRTFVPLGNISPYLVAATIATEDKEFYNHPGFDPFALTRALWQNYTSGEVVSGASTITQQLARALMLDPEERYEQTVSRKAREIILAAEITRRYSKDQIMELYLNENYYGNLAYGIEAAAETYFNVRAKDLTFSQSTFLAGLPQAPGIYDIITNRDITLNRQKQVILLSYTLSREEGCIEVSNSPDRVCVDETLAAEAAREMEAYQFQIKQGLIKYPHWVTFIRAELENRYDPQTIYRSGFTVFTTLDPKLQDQAQAMVSQQVGELADRNVSNGALVAIQPATGEVLAMVGSADFYNADIDGQVNMAVAPRQPGSSVKPLTYVAAFEKGWTPATLIWDVRSEFPPSGDPNDPMPPYIPVNYDERFHGPVTVRAALANSYNIPAVKTLQFIGIYDNPDTPEQDGFIKFAERLGITTLTREDYGLSLTLGGGDVSLLELTSANATFANSGKRMPPVVITRILDFKGNEIFKHEHKDGDQVVRLEHAYLISDILSDNQARAPMFGSASVLNLNFRVAAKTGTTNDFRDNWTLGYTPDLAVGVWVGNADYTPMQNTTGLTGAAPIWSQFMSYAVPEMTGGNPSWLQRPDGIVDRVICSISGAEPSEWCPQQQSEIFARDQLPEPKENDLWQEVEINTWTKLKASPYCSEFTRKKFVINVKDPWGIKWIEDSDQGRDWARSVGFDEPFHFVPAKECTREDEQPQIIFAGLNEDQTITSAPLDIYAVVTAPSNFDSFRLEWGRGNDPDDWKTLEDGIREQFSEPERITTWDLKDVPSGNITLRIYLESDRGTYAEKRLHLKIKLPTPTPTLTFTPTATPTDTPEPTITQTPEPTVTATSTPPSTLTPTPVGTPSP